MTGVKCRYNATDCLDPKIKAMVDNGEAIAVCPEVLAGLPTPRPACEQKDGRVVSENGEDMTEKFRKGARMVLEICQKIM